MDGNKRTALDVALTFLAINGHEIASEHMDLFDAMIAIAERKMSKEELAQLFEKLVVHGHTITPSPALHNNRIGIDTGAYASGRLTCLVLDTNHKKFLMT